MVVNNKFRRFGGMFVAFIILMCYIVIPAGALQYGTNYPSYIPYSGAVYCEVQSSLGLGSLIFPSTYQSGYLSLGTNNNYIFNSSGNTITGVFRTASGTDYSIRATPYNQLTYAVTNGYQTTYENFNISQILNTNIIFRDFSNQNKQNDNVYFFNTIEKLTFIVPLISLIFECFIFFLLIVRVKHD